MVALLQEFLRARMNDYSDTVRTRDELIVRDPKKQFVPCSEMFDLRPATLRRTFSLFIVSFTLHF